MRKKSYMAQQWRQCLARNSGSPLANLLSQAEQVAKNQKIVRSALDEKGRQHCWLASYQNNILYLQSDTAAWATRIRMQQQVIIRQLKSREYFQDIRAMRITVRPRQEKPSPKIKAKALSDLTLAHIKQSSVGIDDNALRTAMENLSRRKEDERQD